MEFDLEQKPLKTWSHLAGNRRKPSEYDIVSKRLHYSTNNPNAPWEQAPDSPMNRWYKKYRNDTALSHTDWDEFNDPDHLVYRTYNLLQDGQENHIFSLFDQFNEREHDRMIDAEWVAALSRIYSPLRYIFHVSQMSSSYVMQMAPASTISNCATFQAADFLRLVTHTSYRTYELSKTYPDLGFGENERELWERAEHFQAMRELMEKHLAVFDWSEAAASLCLVIVPMISEAILKPLALASGPYNDTLMPLLVTSQLNDSSRHSRWAKALVQFLAAENNDNMPIIEGYVEKWKPLADEAIKAYLAEFPEGTVCIEDVLSDYNQSISDLLR